LKNGAAGSIAFQYGPTDVRILFIGDIFAKSGRDIARRAIPAIVERHQIDFVIANVENSAAGFGVTGDIADTILEFGVDVMTSGNHVWDKKEVLDYLPRQPKLLRPANFPAGVPGRGSYLGRTRTGEPVGVINLMGRIFMTPLDDPFAAAAREIEAMRAKTRVIIVDFHAEATSEKIAMGWHLDGRATAVFGTHTHVQTADERILPKGTACLTDVGMTGPHDSIIGVTVEAALGRFLTGMPAKFEAATGPARLNAVVVTADPATGKATAIERLNMSTQEVDALAAASVPAR
jgi:2',3'-cyclic-nucleotide 2'-phosphodiesterase